MAAVRSPDPFRRVVITWIVRRLSPDSNSIEHSILGAKLDETHLRCGMGAEAANVHIGSRSRPTAVLKYLPPGEGLAGCMTERRRWPKS